MYAILALVASLLLAAVPGQAVLPLLVPDETLTVATLEDDARRELQGPLRNCRSVTIPPCARQNNGDIIFLVDASDSLDSARFYGQMLDFVQVAFCGFATGTNNRAAMVTFAKTVKTQIPLARYTAEQWFSRVEAVRQDSSVCCKCCTPTAEALEAARLILEASPPLGDPWVQFTMILSDGDPWQNTKGRWGTKKVGPAAYTYRVVPGEARALKDVRGKDNVKLLFLGVPNKNNQPPEIGYFRGIGMKGSRQCQRRRRRLQCVNIPPDSSLYPLTSEPAEKYTKISANWDVQQMIELISPDLCEPQFISPTQSPSRAPTSEFAFRGLDLYLFLDRSLSMRWRAANCRAAPGSDPTAGDQSVCWRLFLGFARMLGLKSADLPPVPQNGGQARIGWQDEYADKTRGLRVWIYGFACADQQTNPIVVQIGERITNETAFLGALDQAINLIPDGGTCPGQAFDRALGMIMANDLIDRPYKAGMLFTDGVFYDQPRPRIASQGFAYFGMLNYALGISIPTNGNNNGLTATEIADQRKQLLAFVNEKPERFINFGAEGYNVLEQIATTMVERLPVDALANYPRIIEKPYWCGFTNNERCLNTNPELFDTSLYCKWIPNDWSNFSGNGRCMDKAWCGWPQAACYKDRFCKWVAGKGCRVK